MSTTIESLEIQVQTSSTQASQGIDALTDSLSKLKNATKGGLGLTSASTQMVKLASALNSINASSIDKIDRLSQSLVKLSNVGKVTISSTLGKNISSLASATANLSNSDFDNIDKLASAMKSLSDVPKAGGLTSTLNALKKLPEINNSMKSFDWESWGSSMRQLSETLTPVANKMSTVGSGLSNVGRKMQSVTTNTHNLSSASSSLKLVYTELAAKIMLVYHGIVRVYNVVKNWITESNKYVEDLNLFTASMGKYSDAAYEYAQRVGELMGIDPADWMRNQGVFNTIIKGFGVSADKAQLMSQNLTQLGYDISSFYNISVSDAMTKLSSGIAGELEPLRRLGYDLSVARLQQEAYNLGINESVNNMTQAEKSQLRYYAIMTQVTTAQGDMGRTLIAPANQMRVFSAQVQQAARSLGNVFIPMLNAVLPYAIAFVKVIRMVGDALASLFGFELPEIDYSSLQDGVGIVDDISSGIDDTSSGLGSAAKQAKKLKDHLLGIDELNVISENPATSSGGSGSSGAGIGGLGSGFEIDLPSYDFLGGLVESRINLIFMRMEKFFKSFGTFLAGVPMVVGALLIAAGNIPLGIALIVAGAAKLGYDAYVNWDAMPDRVKSILREVTSAVSDAFFAIGFILLATGNVVPGIGLLLAGVAMKAASGVINWKFAPDKIRGILLQITGLIGAATLAVGILLAFSGNILLGLGLIAAGVTTLAVNVILNWDYVPNTIRNVLSVIMTIAATASLVIGLMLVLSGAGLFLGLGLLAVGAFGLGTALGANWNSMSDTIKNVINKILGIGAALTLAVGLLLVITGVGLPLGIGLLIASAGMLATSVALNWNWIVDKVKGVLQKINDLWHQFMDPIRNSPIGAFIFGGTKDVEGGEETYTRVKGKLKGWVSDLFDTGKDGGHSFSVGMEKGIGDFSRVIKDKVVSPAQKTLKGNPISTAVTLEDNTKQLAETMRTWWKDKTRSGLETSAKVSLSKHNWKTVKDWIGNIPTITQKVGLSKDKWSSVAEFVRQGASAVTVPVNLSRGNFKNISTFIGQSASVAISLTKKGWKDLNDFLGLKSAGQTIANIAVSAARGLATGGFITGNGINTWGNIPMYASGTSKVHGSMFVAGESGAEVVGHIGGRTEVLNKSQIAVAMREATVRGVAQFTGYWSAMLHQMATCTNAIVNAVLIAPDVSEMVFADGGHVAANMSNSYNGVANSIDSQFSEESMTNAMRMFYQQYVEPTLSEIATDTKRQADKEERTEVRISGRTLADEVKRQTRADGYGFVK